jgi:hypothetical protein
MYRTSGALIGSLVDSSTAHFRHQLQCRPELVKWSCPLPLLRDSSFSSRCSLLPTGCLPPSRIWKSSPRQSCRELYLLPDRSLSAQTTRGSETFHPTRVARTARTEDRDLSSATFEEGSTRLWNGKRWNGGGRWFIVISVLRNTRTVTLTTMVTATATMTASDTQAPKAFCA